jgi:hypothetical protein
LLSRVSAGALTCDSGWRRALFFRYFVVRVY